MGGTGPPVVPRAEARRGPRTAPEAPGAPGRGFSRPPPRAGLQRPPGPSRGPSAGPLRPRPARRRLGQGRPCRLKGLREPSRPGHGAGVPMHRTYFRPRTPPRRPGPAAHYRYTGHTFGRSPPIGPGPRPAFPPGSGPRTGSASPLDSELQSIPRSRTYFRDAAVLNTSPYRYTGHTFGLMVVKSSETRFRADSGPAPHLVFISIQRYTGHSWRPSITLHRTYFRHCTHVKPDILLPLNRTYFGCALPLNRTYHYR